MRGFHLVPVTLKSEVPKTKKNGFRLAHTNPKNHPRRPPTLFKAQEIPFISIGIPLQKSKTHLNSHLKNPKENTHPFPPCPPCPPCHSTRRCFEVQRAADREEGELFSGAPRSGVGRRGPPPSKLVCACVIVRGCVGAWWFRGVGSHLGNLWARSRAGTHGEPC